LKLHLPAMSRREFTAQAVDGCGVLITEWSTVAKRDGKIFCCANCATRTRARSRG
jgi:hypothetical protein